jgi:hypothetical protein
MEWRLISEKPGAGGSHLTIAVAGYTLNTIIPDGPGREQIIETYVQQVATLVAENERRRTAAAKAQDTPAAKSGGCGCAGKKSLGLLSLGKALLGGAASPELTAQRLAICQACQATDPTGARLYRIIDGNAYCGVPRLATLGKVYRDEREWGCGCELEWKAGMAAAGCPMGQW